MDFKSLRTQILANLENYDEKESKVVIIKLLDFLIEINEKRTHLEEENQQLFAEMGENKVTQHENEADYKARVEELMEKANQEIAKRFSKADNDVARLIEEKKIEADKIIIDAENKSREIINDAILKMQELVKEIEIRDEEAKLYRAHILSIFRKTIFRFSDSNYYIIRSDDKDFRELLNFFEVDGKLQKLCDENIKKLMTNESYLRITEQVKENPEVSEIVEIKSILPDKEKIDDKNLTEIKFTIESEKAEEIHNTETFVENNNVVTNQKFLEIMNKYKKKS